MERWQLADIVATNPHCIPFGDEPSPLHLRFQAAYHAVTTNAP
ncbi:hypothetical protein [Kingella sp. (in: b-proteobacteria)]|nr:hypothetical protein [Kingella sp. (in: b-proteobacteria)]MDO4658320.1 hypothetical protein [Kingella sp. (in: b-proteobacteria)]